MCLECFVDEHRHEGTPTIQLPTALEIVETQREVQYITTEIQIVELEIPEHLLPRPPAAPRIAPKKANRCFECNRKLGVMGFKCRCESSFCNRHRLPESHGCNFDHREFGRQQLREANPLVRAEKVIKI
mmetsp:Transcript_114/g.338  ORF Transcript_114/g.338 Transcript_114/m.338 type:complete len:129 (+) Transcript_114:382-768(+)